MTQMMNTHTNGANRKHPSLSEQINRLDHTLDGLADGLQEAVADAVKGVLSVGLREAVQTVLTEVLTNPEILARLHALKTPAEPSTAPVAPPKVTWRQRLVRICCRLAGVLSGAVTLVAALREAAGGKMRTLRASLGNCFRRAMGRVAFLGAHWEMVRHCKRQILIATGVGVAVGVTVWYAGPWLGAAAGALGGFLTTLSVQAGIWLRKTIAGTSHLEQMA